ncbi:hypothetical protein RB608_07730 [Nocardioides sp. LHD-245]|uniref:hypothetical protein n=1 Tax=Nocardioides sp. LHD-245 TaxID=3051387 RepID=UPI0027DF9427|nr:hypothetical protein [Nocardioides sp. LHD-245]
MMFDLRVFLLAALIASPVAVLTARGELSLDEALGRLLLVMVGATAAALLVRTLWPLLAGPVPDLPGAPDPTAPEAGETALVDAEALSRPSE